MRSFVLLILALSIAACSPAERGSGALCDSRGPLILGLTLLPDTAAINEGGGSIDVTATVDYRTRDGAKLADLLYELIDASGTTVSSELFDLYPRDLQGSGTYDYTFPVPTDAAQIYRFRVQLQDECLTLSDWAEADFTVT